MAYCERCSGRKKLYKKGGGYTLLQSGGKLVTCPLCMGTGKQVPLEDKIAQIKAKDVKKPEVKKSELNESEVKESEQDVKICEPELTTERVEDVKKQTKRRAKKQKD